MTLDHQTADLILTDLPAWEASLDERQKQIYESTFKYETAESLPAAKQRFQAVSAVAAYTGHDVREVSRKWETWYMPAFARDEQVGLGLRAGVNDGNEFFKLITERAQLNTTKREWQNEAQQAAFTAALSGRPMLDALREWQGVDAGPQKKERLEITPAFMTAYRESSARLRPYRGQIAEVAEMARVIDTNPDGANYSGMADILIGIPEGDRPLVIEALRRQSASKSKDDAFRRTIFAFDRGLERFVNSSATGARNAAESFALSFVGQALRSSHGFDVSTDFDPENVAQREAYAKYQDLRDDLRDIATQELSPLADVRLLGANITGVAENAPMTLAAFIPYVGPAMMAGSFYRETENELRHEYPEMTREQRSTVAAWSAPFQAASEIISNRLLFGRLPNFQRAFTSPALVAGSVARQFGGRLAVASSVEVAEELFQQATPRAVMTIQKALGQDVPQVDWSGFFSKFGSNLPELLSIVVPMALIGAGVGQISDFSYGRSLAQNPDALIAATYSPEAAQQISAAAEAGNWKHAESLMRAEWQRVNQAAAPLTEVAQKALNNAQVRLIEQARTQSEQQAEEMRTAEVSIRKSPDGWQVITDGGPATFPTHEEAYLAAVQEMERQGMTRDDRTMKLFEEFSRTAKEGQAVIIDDSVLTMADAETDAKARGDQKALDAIYARAEVFRRKENRPDMPLDQMRVLGRSSIEMKEGVATYAMRIYDGAQAVDLLEEKAETDAKRWFSEGRTTADALRGMIAQAEQATGDTYLHGDTDTAVIEAYSDLVRIWATGTRKGEVSRTVQKEARERRRKLKKAGGPLTQLLQETMDFFREVLTKASRLMKAKRAGKLGDIEAFLNESLGLDEQAAHVEAVTREVQDMEADSSFSLTNLSGAEQHLRSLSGQPMTTADGLTATVSNQTAAKMSSASAVRKSVSPAAHLEAIQNFQQLFEAGSIAETHPDRANDPNIVALHRVNSSMEFEGRPLTVKFTVKEFARDQGNRIYSIEAMDLEGAPSAGQLVHDTSKETARGTPITEGAKEGDSKNSGGQTHSLNDLDTFSLGLYKGGGLSGGKGVEWADGESRIIQGLAQINSDSGAEVGLVSRESEKPDAYASAGRSIPPYTEQASVGEIIAEEGRLIDRAKQEGFFWDAAKVQSILAKAGDKGGGSEHDVYVFDDGDNAIVIRSTIQDSYGFRHRSPAQYLKRLENYNNRFPGIQMRMIGVSLNARGNGVIWTAQPFVEGKEFKEEAQVQKALEKRGWKRITSEEPVYRHEESGTVIRDAHAGNILAAGKELYPIDVIVDDVAKTTYSLALSDRLDALSVALGEQTKAKPEARRALIARAQERYLVAKADWERIDRSAKALSRAASETPDRFGTELAQLRADFDADLAEIRHERETEVGGARQDKAGKETINRIKAEFSTQIEKRRTQYERDRRAIEDKQAAEEAAQAKEQGRVSKAEQIAALRALDAVTSVLPAEMRGKVGGFIKLAELNTNAARIDEIERRFAKVGELLEKHFQKELTEQFQALLEKARADGAGGEKVRGKIGVEAHRWFAQVEPISAMSQDDVTAEQAKQEEILGNAERSPEDQAAALEIWTLLHQFGAWADKSASEMDTGLRMAEAVYKRGRDAWKTILEARKAEREEWRSTALQELGGPADWPTLQRAQGQQARSGQRSKVGEWFYRHGSFQQLLTDLFGRGEVAARYEAKAREATRKKTDAMRLRIREYRDAMLESTGAKTWRVAQKQLIKLQTRVSDAPVTFYGKPSMKTVEITADKLAAILEGTLDPKTFGLSRADVDLLAEDWAANTTNKQIYTLEKSSPGQALKGTEISQLEAVHFTMLARQEQYQKAMELHGITADTLEQAEEWLTPEARAIRAWLFSQYSKGYGSLNEVYQRMFGADLPQVREYAPGYWESDNKSTDLDPFGSGVEATGLAAGFLKKRKVHLARPRQIDAMQAYWQHVQQVEHWKAWAELMSEMRSVLGNRDVLTAIEAKAGSGARADMIWWMDTLEQNGVRDAQGNDMLQKIMRAQARVALAYKASVILKQLPAAIGSLADVPAGAWINGVRRVLTGQGAASLAEMWKSEAIQRRVESGYSPEMRAAMRGPTAKPDLLGDAIEWGMQGIANADAAFTSFSVAVAYDYHYREALKSGANEQQAAQIALEQMENTIGRTAQPGELMDRSRKEIEAQGLAKLMVMFESAQRQAWSLVYFSVRGALKGEVSKAEMARVVFTHFILGPAITQTMAGLVRYMFTDDDAEEAWSPADYLTAMALGPTSGIMIFGAALDVLSQWGGYGPRNNNPISNALGDLLNRGGKEDWTTNDLGTMAADASLLASGFVNPSVEAVGVTWNVLKQILGISENVMEGKDR